MKRIYIAGPYSAGDVLTVFENMRRGMMLSTKVRQLGFAPFSPWMDFMYYFLDEKKSFNLENCYEYSLAWLEVSDAILFTPSSASPSWVESKGAVLEHEFAVRHKIPIYYKVEDLVV